MNRRFSSLPRKGIGRKLRFFNYNSQNSIASMVALAGGILALQSRKIMFPFFSIRAHVFRKGMPDGLFAFYFSVLQSDIIMVR